MSAIVNGAVPTGRDALAAALVRESAGFGPAMTRALASLRAGLALPAGPRQLSAGPLLAQRRRDASDGQARLGARRDEAAVAREAALDPALLVRGEGATPESAPAIAFLPASAIERVAIAVQHGRDRASIELGFGPGARIRITRAVHGVELLLQAGAGSRAAADAELPRLVAALRARGIKVVRARSGERPRGAGALTSPRPSDRTATLKPGGTVAKW